MNSPYDVFSITPRGAELGALELINSLPAYRVFLYMGDLLEVDDSNVVYMVQSEVCTALGLHKTNFSRYVKHLIDVDAIRKKSNKYYMINPSLRMKEERSHFFRLMGQYEAIVEEGVSNETEK